MQRIIAFLTAVSVSVILVAVAPVPAEAKAKPNPIPVSKSLVRLTIMDKNYVNRAWFLSPSLKKKASPITLVQSGKGICNALNLGVSLAELREAGHRARLTDENLNALFMASTEYYCSDHWDLVHS